MSNEVNLNKKTSSQNGLKIAVVIAYVLLAVCLYCVFSLNATIRDMCKRDNSSVSQMDTSVSVDTTQSDENIDIKTTSPIDYRDFGFNNLGYKNKWILVKKYNVPEKTASIKCDRSEILSFSFDTNKSWITTNTYFRGQEHTYNGPYTTLSNSEAKIEAGSRNQSYVGWTIKILDKMNVSGMLIMHLEFSGYSGGAEQVNEYYAIPSDYLYDDYDMTYLNDDEVEISYMFK